MCVHSNHEPSRVIEYKQGNSGHVLKVDEKGGSEERVEGRWYHAVIKTIRKVDPGITGRRRKSVPLCLKLKHACNLKYLGEQKNEDGGVGWMKTTESDEEGLRKERARGP